MAIDAPREWRSLLSAILRENEPFRVKLSAEGGGIRLFAFPLNASGTLIGEEWRCGDDRPVTPAIRLDGNCFEVRLGSLPDAVQSVSFALSLEEGFLTQHQALILQDGEKLRFTPESADLKGLNALVSLLIYRKNGWRVRCVGMGFSGGAKALFGHHGAAMPAPVKRPPMPVQSAPAAPAAPKRPAAPVQTTPAPIPPKRPPVPAPAAPVRQASVPGAAPREQAAVRESAQPVLLAPYAMLQRIHRYLRGPAEVWAYGTDCVCMGVLRPDGPAPQPPRMAAFPNLYSAMKKVAAAHPEGCRVTVLTQGGIGQSRQLIALMRETPRIRWDLAAAGGVGYGALPALPQRLPNVTFRQETDGAPGG